MTAENTLGRETSAWIAAEKARKERIIQEGNMTNQLKDFLRISRDGDKGTLYGPQGLNVRIRFGKSFQTIDSPSLESLDLTRYAEKPYLQITNVQGLEPLVKVHNVKPLTSSGEIYDKDSFPKSVIGEQHLPITPFTTFLDNISDPDTFNNAPPFDVIFIDGAIESQRVIRHLYADEKWVLIYSKKEMKKEKPRIPIPSINHFLALDGQFNQSDINFNPRWGFVRRITPFTKTETASASQHK